jgi:predicted permease
MTAEERTELSRVPRLLALAVGLLLLIACSSVAGLSLVRAAARRRELATRLALGASRAVLVRQVVLEGAVIAAGAGLLGVVVARALVRSATLVRSVVPMRGLDVSADPRVLGAALAVSALTAVLVSLLPAIQLFRVPPGAVLKDGGGGALRRRSGQRALVAAQMGASLVLLAAAAIVHGAFQRVLATHDELDPGGLTYVSLDADRSMPDTVQQLAFYRAALARAASEPGIAGATITSSVPPLPWSSRATVFRAGEEPPREALVGRELELGVRVNAVTASPDFFGVMRIPIARGRAFTARDDERGERIAIVSRRLAEALWPGREAVGQLLAWPSIEGPPRPPLRVVGVAADTRDLALSANPPLAMYLPMAQHPSRGHVLVVRTHGGVPVTRSAMHQLVADVDPDVAVLGGRTLRDELRDQLRPQRTASAWIGVFGAIALLLASIGLYGIVAEGVLQRTRELALRCALGAPPGRILGNVLGDGMRLVTVGAIAGGLGALAAFRVVRSFFSGVQTVDMRSTVVAVALLLMATVAAAYLPARRATRLNPADALRCD